MKENWIEIELGNHFETVTGNTPSKKMRSFYNGDIPFIKPPELQNSIISKYTDTLTEEGSKKSRILPIGSTLVTCIGNLGRVGINLHKKVAFNQQINAIKPNIYIIPKFTFYQCQSPQFKNQLAKLSSSTTVPIVNKGKFNTIKYRFPSLPTQRAIVAKIEQLFSELDNGTQNLQQAKEKLAVFRQAVLKKAFEGELTKEWRKKNESSSSEKWSISSFGEICDFKGGGTPSKKNTDYWNGDLPWASIKDIKGDYLVKTQDKITELGYENSSANIAEAGEIIIGTRINPGRPIFSKIRTAINQDLKVVKPKIDLNTTFLFYLFKEKENDILKVSSGTTVLGINLNNLREIEIHIPNSVEEQNQIVQEIESRLSVCDEMEKSIESSLKKAEALRQSILKKAFEGELLTDKEIDLCKQEPDWETAAVLLERIRKEKN